MIKPPRTKLDWSGIKAKRKIAEMHPNLMGNLGVGRVLQVDYEEHYVMLRIVMGSMDIIDRAPIPLSFPGAGNRHFLGSLPEIGDYCIVGWMPQESGPWTKIPVILSWIIPGVWPGREWLATQGFTEDEYDFGTQFQREAVQGVFQRIRHKLRHMQPGNIVGSSSQGSDLILDESATLANRRCNELILRDQDQALVVRTLQQFHAMSGARIYGGMVQRDATTLAPTMVSDGLDWDSDYQTVAGRPIPEEDFLPSLEPEGYMTPADILYRRSLQGEEGSSLVGTPMFRLPAALDPYVFLKQGGLIDDTGYALTHPVQGDTYGGKPVFRVAAQSRENAAVHADVPTLTEWRLEVTHTSDGTLPVTEQTDLFDAERLPPSDFDLNNPLGQNTQMPFIEFVLGSVVGNDPFTPYGKQRYGVPLMATIFDGDVPAPRLDPVKLVPDNSTGEVPVPLNRHAATLFRLLPPEGNLPETFWSVNKLGQLKVAIGGPPDENSVEAALAGGLKLSCGGPFTFAPKGSLLLRGDTGDRVNNVGASLESAMGAVVIRGGGRVTGPRATTNRISGPEDEENQSPSVMIEADHGAEIRANRRLMMKGSQILQRSPSIRLEAHQEANVTAVDKLTLNSKEIDVVSGGKRVEHYTGPKDNLPTAGPLREEVYSPNIPGQVVHRSEYTNGSREETFTLGDHTTTMQVGNLTYETESGEFKARAGQNTLSIDMTRLKAEVTTSGGIVMKATTGPMTLKGSTTARLEATSGPVIVKGSVVRLRAPVDNNQGGIVCGGSIDPLTGQPLSSFGMGAPNHIVSA